jgi:hypothetical protein
MDVAIRRSLGPAQTDGRKVEQTFERKEVL